MTEQEAIQEIKRWTGILMNAGSQCVMDTAEAQGMAISALEEVQQYRALGTVEEIKKKLKTELPYMSIAQAKFKRELDAYKTLGTVEELREAREKQRAKKIEI